MNNDEHQEDYKAAAIALIGADRMGVGLPSLHDKRQGDLVPYARLALLTIKVWSDLTRLKSAVHEGYQSTLQMTGDERTEMMVLATRVGNITNVLERRDQ